MKPRMRVRTPASKGSNQSAPRKSVPSAASVVPFVVSVFMAWSPSARQRRVGWLKQRGDYATFKFQPLPRRHPRTSPRRRQTLFDAAEWAVTDLAADDRLGCALLALRTHLELYRAATW